MAFVLVAHDAKGSTDGIGVTVGPLNTTGATLIVLLCSRWDLAGAEVVITDSLGNAWQQLGPYPHAFSFLNCPEVRGYYCLNPVVGATQTFTWQGYFGSHYPSLAVRAYSGTSPLLDTVVGFSNTTTSATTIQPGTLTPAGNNELLVSAVAWRLSASVSSINASFNLSDSVAWNDHQNFGLAVADQIQTTGTARNPTWTMDTAVQLSVFQVAFITSAGATGQIIVSKTTSPPGQPGVFQFTAGGGLSPSTFSLSDGESQTFAGVTAGSGYSITETAVPNWQTDYVVSNGTHTNITVAAGVTTNVGVTNTYPATPPVTTNRKIRRRRQGPHMSNEQLWAFHKYLQIDMEVGVGNSDAPAPTGTLKWSDDGGYTWSAGITGSLGAAAAYLTRVIFFRLGRSRDRVYRWDIDDPVKVALINGYTDVEPGNGA